ncbi:hypothetical protein D9M71_324420 [compost metagenome]
MAPETAPNMLGLPRYFHSTSSQARAPAQLASMVLTITSMAKPLAASTQPPQKPSQPTHSRQPPVTVMVMLCGDSVAVPKPRRRPISQAPTSEAMPTLRCTTLPPAKSCTPSANTQPPPQAMCAMGM